MEDLKRIIQLLESIDEKLGSNKKKRKSPDYPSETTPSGIFWKHYARYYELRWKVDPARNAMVNGMIRNIIVRIPQEDHQRLIHFFINQNDSWYLKEMHHLRCLLKDCEMLLTRMKSGAVITTGKARMMENASDNLNEAEKFMQKKRGSNAE